MQRKPKSYSSALMDQIPIKYLIRQAQGLQQELGGIYVCLQYPWWRKLCILCFWGLAVIGHKLKKGTLSCSMMWSFSFFLSPALPAAKNELTNTFKESCLKATVAHFGGWKLRTDSNRQPYSWFEAARIFFNLLCIPCPTTWTLGLGKVEGFVLAFSFLCLYIWVLISGYKCASLSDTERVKWYVLQ